MRASRAAVLGSIVPLILGSIAISACGRGGPARSPEGGTLRTTGVGANVDPTLRGARILPEVVDESVSYGSEAGGGTRVITAGLRVVTATGGAIVAAEDRLPQAPMITTALPERLGGGFLFVLGSTVWRADHWLDTAKPIFTSIQSIQGIVPGLDRVYIRAQSSYLAIDGKTGKVLDLGPWPASPFVSSYAAADGWRAAAVTDLRGVVATFDAGATWRALDLPMEPRQVLASGDALAVGGIENAKAEARFEIRGDGSISRMAGAPREAKGKMLPTAARPYPTYPGGYPGAFIPPPHMFTPPAPTPTPRTASTTDRDRDRDSDGREDAQDAATRIFGKRPLAAAIEDGWPLTDGTAIVARDGAIARVRLSDGALLEMAQGAFPLKPSRCHPVSLNRQNALGAFGFVCGESRGPSALYAFDPMRARLVELKRFDRPRVITSSGNGAIAVRGPCAEDADPSSPPREPTRIVPKDNDAGADGGKGALADKGRDDKSKGKDRDKDGDDSRVDGKDKDVASDKDAPKEIAEAKPLTPEMHPFCVLGHDNTWREVHVRGDVGAERVIVLTDGKIAVVSPPQGQNAVARLTLLDNGKATTLPIAFPKVGADVARVLRLGIWLDGFEERKPGVLGGWVEAGGSMLGIEIALDGKATVGQYIRDAGMPFVSGRYGLGWNAAKKGFETTDGGMTWTLIDVPEPIVPVTKVERRACGPIGCLAAGWLRVGWGESKKPPSTPVPPPQRSTVSVSAPSLSLQCEPMDAPMPPPPSPKPKVVAKEPPPQPGVRRTFGGPAVLASPTVPGMTELPAFFSHAGPNLRDTERGSPYEVQEMPDRGARLGALARVYLWGPKTGDWDTQGKWQVKWLSPFGGWPDAKASLPVLPPQILVDFSRAGGAYGGYYGSYYSTGLTQLVPGDDAAHTLLLVTRQARTDVVPFELEADRAPVEIHRADGEPFPGDRGIEAATRAAGRWFLATPSQAGAATPSTTIWQVDGSVARELVRVQRASLETNRPTGTRLARRSDGRAIGLVVDGQATAERTTLTRWVLPIDLESGQLGEPEALGYTDLAGRTLEACTDDIVGWVFDTPLNASTVRMKLPQTTGSMHSLYGRVRLTATRSCVERLAGMFDSQTAERAAVLARTGARTTSTAANATTSGPRQNEIVATAFGGQSRFALRCTVAK